MAENLLFIGSWFVFHFLAALILDAKYATEDEKASVALKRMYWPTFNEGVFRWTVACILAVGLTLITTHLKGEADIFRVKCSVVNGTVISFAPPRCVKFLKVEND